MNPFASPRAYDQRRPRAPQRPCAWWTSEPWLVERHSGVSAKLGLDPQPLLAEAGLSEELF